MKWTRSCWDSDWGCVYCALNLHLLQMKDFSKASESTSNSGGNRDSGLSSELKVVTEFPHALRSNNVLVKLELRSRCDSRVFSLYILFSLFSFPLIVLAFFQCTGDETLV